jgi:hypothetical protein
MTTEHWKKSKGGGDGEKVAGILEENEMDDLCSRRGKIDMSYEGNGKKRRK